MPTSRSLSAHDPRFDEEVCMLSPVHASHDGVNTALSAEEAGGFALSTPRQGQLAGLRDAVGNRVTLVGFCISEYSHWIATLLETGYICYAGVSQCIFKSAKFYHFCYSFFSLPLIFTGKYMNFSANKYYLFV